MARIFVFGSNLAGRHGAGAALYARQHHGAIYGRGTADMVRRARAAGIKVIEVSDLPRPSPAHRP